MLQDSHCIERRTEKNNASIVQKALSQFHPQQLRKSFRVITKWYSKRNYRLRELVFAILTSEYLTFASYILNKSSYMIWKSKQSIPRSILDPALNSAKLLVSFNGVILILWNLAAILGDGKLLEWMELHFLHPSDVRLIKRNPHTSVTSVFSHYDIKHFLSNMSALWLFLPGVYRSFKSARQFYYFYVFSSLGSEYFNNWIFSQIPVELITGKDSLILSLAEVIYAEVTGDQIAAAKWIRDKVPDRTERQEKHVAKASLGASGVLYAIMTYNCLAFPESTFEIADTRLSAPVSALVWALNDLIVLGNADGIGHGAHLGGSLFGAIVYFVQQALRGERWNPKFSTARNERYPWRR